MEFIIQNIGWFFGIGFVLLFALIGYFSDKKESKENIKQKNNSDSVDNNLLNNVDKQEQLKELNVENSIGEISEQNIVSNDNIDNGLSNLASNEFKNIEDTHMSLDDLEKKKYNEILNNKNNYVENIASTYGVANDSYINDSIENYNDLSGVDDDEYNNSFNDVQGTTEANFVTNDLDNELGHALYDSNTNFDSTDNDMSSSIVPELNNSVDDNNFGQLTEQDDMKMNNFSNSSDNLGVSQGVPELTDNEIVNDYNVLNNNVDVNLTDSDFVYNEEISAQKDFETNAHDDSIEQFNQENTDDNDSMLDFYDDSSDDDIWRF